MFSNEKKNIYELFIKLNQKIANYLSFTFSVAGGTGKFVRDRGTRGKEV
jgi:hypothetical protein